MVGAVVINNEFKHILEPLTNYGWQFVKEDSIRIQMNKKYSELDEISVSVSKSSFNPSASTSYANSDVIHITLPIKNSCYSFYKKHNDLQQSIMFLQKYVAHIIA